MTLNEKGLPWTSHHLDLKLKANISDEYFGINPNGLVPTLIDNGVVHIESNDIIDYLDETYPEPSLRAVSNEDEMLEWLRLAASIHVPAVKPYVYATKMQKKLKKTAEEQKKYDELQKNEELKKFHAKHAGGSEFDEKDIARAHEILEECFTKLENALEDREWITGVNGGGIMHHARRPGGPVAAAQNCATHGPLLVVARGRRCTAWSSMRRFDWRLSTRV